MHDELRDLQLSELHTNGEILVVEDTPASLKLLAGLLNGAGYRVREAPNGELALWSARAQPPELILLDVRMPGMDGYEVCRQLKDTPALKEVPVIFLSAYDDTDARLRGFQAGAVDFISKPYQFEEVNARVMAHLKIGRLQHKLARESRLRLAELAHMNRNASATAYCAALVHELNQPLAAIMSNADAASLFLKMDPPQLQEVDEILADIRRDDLRASELIQQMRELLKKSEPAALPLDLNDVVRNGVALLASEARARKAALRLDLAAAALPVAADRIQLQQVMINLVLNALDAMAATPETARAVCIRTALSADGQAEVLVCDQGSGFEGPLERVFDSFFTTKPQGMGLGLSITAAIVSAHGGRIWAENNAEHGATLYFTLPLADRRSGPHVSMK